MAPSAALAPVIEAFEQTRWAIEVTDPQWRIVWASSEMCTILGATESEGLGIGRHVLEARQLPAYDPVPDESGRRWLELHLPFMLADGQSREELRELVDPLHAPLVDDAQPVVPPPRWSFTLDLVGPRTSDRAIAIGERVLDADGRLLGNAFVYGTDVPASLLQFLTRGDEAMFRRMADLLVPARRPASILFADVEGSTDRSRRLPSARYFEEIRKLNAGIDRALLDHDGIIGKHAGDGVSAFFLVDQLGSPSAAARAAVAAARGVQEATAAVQRDWKVNVGVHWGATLYMGQIATSGRLEVTALGDEVNECARIQEAARGGQLLASKDLLERLDRDDAAALGLDPTAVLYALIRDLPGASEKALRDAPTLPVALLNGPAPAPS